MSNTEWDEDVTNRIIELMLKKKRDSNLKLPDSFPEFKSDFFGIREDILKKTLNRKEGEEIINLPLYIFLNDLSKNLFIKFIQHSINFDKKEICAVIALDLCRTIDKSFKLIISTIIYWKCDTNPLWYIMESNSNTKN